MRDVRDMPKPPQFLRALRKITHEALVLTSAIIATRIRGVQGVLELPAAAMHAVYSGFKRRVGMIMPPSCGCPFGKTRLTG